MVFPSVPVYPDPANWPQVQHHDRLQQREFPLPTVVPPPPGIGGGGTGGGLIRPNSMAERARLAKLPQPETALKCPRCESTNTKFCYFNNYSLSQPRHFCKTCRRYWTRGGALRNVPVGGGCRRNKRSKGGSGNTRSKSPITPRGTEHQSTATINNSSSRNCTVSSTHDGLIIGHNLAPPHQLPFLPPNLHAFTDLGTSNGDMGLNLCGIQASPAAIGGGNTLNLSSNSARFGDQWRLQQFPSFFSAGLDQQQGSYNLGGDQQMEPILRSYVLGGAISDHQLGFNNNNNKALETDQTNDHLASVKLGENQGTNLFRALSTGAPGISNGQYWGGGNTWTDLSAGGCSASSASHLI